MTRVAAIAGLDPVTYRRHPLHGEECAWVEKNCYVDLWIEVLHALGLEPAAMLAFVVAVDFEGDQWTFFKPPHDELRELYGVDTQELTVWRPLADHAEEYLGSGRLISTEADAFWLPDTAGTDYRAQHTKTTIVLQEVDVASRRLGYFHNAGYFELEGDDFDAVMRTAGPPSPDALPLFAEILRVDRAFRLTEAELRARSRDSLRRHLARRPIDNPVRRFGERLERDLPWLQERGLATYHLWAFATVRQLGAAFELAAAHARWLDGAELVPAAEAFDRVSSGAKTLILKAARAVNSRRPLDARPVVDEIADAWARGVDALERRLGG